MAERTGDTAVVYFTRDLSANGLIKAYEQVNGNIEGRVAVKLHTGEKNGPNIIPREWVKALMAKDLKDASIIETNTYYEGDRYTTAKHRETLKVNGWTFAPVDILDEEDTVTLPVVGGKWFGPHPLQRAHTRRFWRQQQEHRHRMCRRSHWQSLDTHHPWPAQPMGHCH